MICKSPRVRSPYTQAHRAQQGSSPGRVWQALTLASLVVAVLSFYAVRSAVAAPRKAARSTAPVSNTGGMCIPPAALQTVDQCDDFKGMKTASGRPPRSQLRTAKRQAEERRKATRKPSYELDVATRRNRTKVQARASSLLQREVNVLKRLAGNTSAEDPRRPEILLRLAETYFEMQMHLMSKIRAYDDPLYKARKARDKARYQKLLAGQKKYEKALRDSRKRALTTYARLIKDHSDFERMDQVLFSLAFGLEELEEFDKARQVYLRLIKQYPQSRFIPHAFLSFGEYYFSKDDMQAALKFYDKVLEYPADKNPVYGYAMYKQAWAYFNVQNYKASLKRFADVIDFAQSRPEDKSMKNLARQARRELVLPYAEVGSPSRALAFFKNKAKTTDQALEMLESLGELYYDTGKWSDAVAVYHELISERPRSDKVCYWQSRVANAVISSKNKKDIVTELLRMVDIQDKFIKERHSGDSKKQCRQVTASLLVEQATAWHREAVGTEGSPGTNDVESMRSAAKLYHLTVEKFPDLDRMEFPDFDKRDWPTRYRIAYYNAELLWAMKNWAECGPAFDRVVELNPRGEFTTDAAYAAVLCYNNLYQQRYQSEERTARFGSDETEEKARDLKRRSFTPLEQGMLRAFNRYICVAKKGKELPTIKYRRARIYYEANHFEEAAAMFQDIAWNHRRSELAEFAANLYLDSLNVMGTIRKPRKPACIVDMTDGVEELNKMYCSGANAEEEYAELCPTIASLECGLLRKKAELLQESKDFKGAARTYVKIYKRYRQSSNECSGRMDEVLYNAAINFEAARLLGRAIQVRKYLIDSYKESRLAKKALFLTGANYHALAIYTKASDYYEDFARQYGGEMGEDCTKEEKDAGTCAVAPEALKNAVFFRLALGQRDKAEADVRLFEKNYRRRLPKETASVVFALGSLYKAQNDLKEVKDHYSSFLRKYRRQSTPGQRIRANVEIGVALRKARDFPKASRYFRAAVREWQKSRGAVARMTDPKEAYEAKSAASEAMFYEAEDKFAEFKRIKFPEYRGGRSLDAVNRWSRTKFAGWVEKKSKALRDAEGAYNEIAEIEVPEWMIAGAARIGQMYASFVDAFREAPVPTEIERDDELYGIYVDALEAQAKKFEKPAVDKFEFCLLRATKVRWFNEWSQSCEKELNRLNPAEYPVENELRGEPDNEERIVAQPSPVSLGAWSPDDSLEGTK